LKKKRKMTKYPMTLCGSDQLHEELRVLKTEKRPRIVKDIATAREHGDLKENAEYHAAKEEQGFCEGRIQDIEGRLCNAQVIDITKIPNHGKVLFGTTVTLLNIDTEVEVTYKIVGDDEADFKTGRISLNSPIARGLIGKEVDSEVEITIPGGVVEYEIVSVEHI
jgi:transcription elongation factor GreA